MNNTKKLIIAAGGTGGHLFPAQRLADAIKKNSSTSNPPVEILFVGDGLKKNLFFDKKFPFLEVSSAHFTVKNPFKLLKSCLKLSKGLFQSLLLIKRAKPDLIIGFGSFHTLPILSASLLMRVPFILHEQNSIPGKVNRLFSPFAKWSAISFPKSQQYLKGRSVETVFPLKDPGCENTKDCFTYFGLDEKKTTILVLGGSQGAKAINNALKESIVELKSKLHPFQIIHLTGFKENVEGLKECYLQNGIQAMVKPFEEHMSRAWKIADVVISRSGAATIFEEIYFEKPSILIPYPFAAENHQFYNAEFYSQTVRGGTILLENSELPTLLSQEICRLLADNGAQLNIYRKNIQEYKTHTKSEDLTNLIFNHLGVVHE